MAIRPALRTPWPTVEPMTPSAPKLNGSPTCSTRMHNHRNPSTLAKGSTRLHTPITMTVAAVLPLRSTMPNAIMIVFIRMHATAMYKPNTVGVAIMPSMLVTVFDRVLRPRSGLTAHTINANHNPVAHRHANATANRRSRPKPTPQMSMFTRPLRAKMNPPPTSDHCALPCCWLTVAMALMVFSNWLASVCVRAAHCHAVFEFDKSNFLTTARNAPSLGLFRLPMRVRLACTCSSPDPSLTVCALSPSSLWYSSYA